MINLNTSIISLPTVGKTIAGRLKKLKIETVKDLIFYFPARHSDLGQVTPISQLDAGQTAVIKVKIDLIENRRAHRRRMFLTEALVSDASGAIKVIWFNQPFLTKTLKVGSLFYLAGKVDYDKFGLEMINPTYELVKEEQMHTARLVPVYPLTVGLTQRQLRFLIKISLGAVKKVIDFLPLEIIKKLKMPALPWALVQVHFPKNKKILANAQHRLKFDELFLIQLNTQLIRQALQQSRSPQIKFKEKETKEFIDSLPFKLTDDQRKATWQILLDLEKSQPMNRLLEGDVGSGKTVVAAIAAYSVILSGWQTIYMAPTEILAQQHFQTINKLFDNKKVKVALLTAGDKRVNFNDKITKSKLLELIKNGEIDFIVGTHALIQQGVEYKKVGLAVVDEQHRFGVEQRHALKQKGNLTPHLLSMTATPIPRSLALTIYGDLDLSLIKQMPKGRKKILTRLVPFDKRDAAYGFINQQIESGRQVFVICPLIDPSDKLGVKSVKLEFEKLDKEVFPHLKIGLLHGKIKTKEKEAVMKEFLENKIKILVATSVIEVGIDVPNATVMMIEGADRFGLAQLHQFRGRVGRSEHQSYCFLFTDSQNEKTTERLKALVQSEDGFALAENDLKFRGPGEVYGVKQSGYLSALKIASLTDYQIIQEARAEAEELIKKDPDLKLYPELKKKVEEFNLAVHLE